jgi:acyl-CoA synthetase (AMP-forming)/AMP-acid ligase II
LAESGAEMATLGTPIRSRAELDSPSCVKIALAGDGRAVYFSRSPVPFVRDADPDRPCGDADLHRHLRERLAPHKTPTVWVHVREFPLTPSGKIQKFVLRDQWLKERP